MPREQVEPYTVDAGAVMPKDEECAVCSECGGDGYGWCGLHKCVYCSGTGKFREPQE
jgi:hypothetical protein